MLLELYSVDCGSYVSPNALQKMHTATTDRIVDGRISSTSSTSTSTSTSSANISHQTPTDASSPLKLLQCNPFSPNPPTGTPNPPTGTPIHTVTPGGDSGEYSDYEYPHSLDITLRIPKVRSEDDVCAKTSTKLSITDGHTEK